MDPQIAREFKNFETLVLESIQSQKETIINHAKKSDVQGVQGAIGKTPVASFRVEDKKWHNWAGNIVFEPEKILYPTNVEDLKGYVKKAKSEGKKIRCAAEGHSWSSLSVTSAYL